MDHSEVKHLPKVDHTPAELAEPAKLLLKAADLIEERGHCKWVTCDDLGRLCLRGALRAAESGGQDTSWWTAGDMALRADAIIRRTLGDESVDGDASAEWNNADGRTPAEVVAKLRAVALGL
jgi:hypothetical protein